MAQGDIRFSLLNGEGAISIVSGDLDADTGLETCILISLFTDARAQDDDVLPDNSLSKRGWWGDSFLEASLGSRLWLLSRATIVPSLLDDAAKHAKECLQWLIEDGVVDKIDVSVTRTDMYTLHIQINVTRPKGDSNIVFKYFYNWQNQLLR
jgi:phage gp46-like protein